MTQLASPEAGETTVRAHRWHPGAGASTSPAERACWTVVGIVLLVWGLRLIGSVTSYPWVTVLAVACIAAGLVTATLSWSASSFVPPGMRAVLPWLPVVLALVAFGVWSYLQVVASPGYGTDEIAFDQYAATLFVHGSNPYLHSMAPAFPLYHVDPNGYTFHLDGTRVTSLSYPSLAFLLYAPLLALGFSAQAAVIVDAGAWVVTVLLLFALLPRSARPLAVVLGSISVFVAYAVGGVTDPLFVPFLLGAAYRWDTFGLARGWRSWRGPVLFGLAMAVKQTPWLILPFLLLGLAQEGYGRGGRRASWRLPARYLAIALAAFLVPNLWFLAQSPGAWLSGVLTPFNGHTVPAGQGVIGLSLYLGWGGGSLTAYSVLSGVALLALLGLQLASGARFKPWVFYVPAVALLLATRSFGSYFVMLAPAGLLAGLTVGRSQRARRLPGPWKGVAAVTMLAAASAMGWALGDRAPLHLTITGVQTSGQLATVAQVTVRATNRTDHPLRPAFTADEGGAVTAFWQRVTGPAVLAAHQSASYTLDAPSYFANPAITGGFQMVAFTSAPATVSHTDAYVPSVEHLILNPDALNAPVPVGQLITVTAELVDRYDRPVHQANVPVYLGQIIYAQQGLEYGQAIINNGQPGQTPATAYTNSQGVATFTIRGTAANSNPVSFEANLVNPTAFYPYGYSPILDVRFTKG